MDKTDKNTIEELLPRYCEGVLGKRRFLPPYFVGLQQIN